MNTTQLTLEITKKQIKRDLRQGILCSLCTVFCLALFKQMWVFAIVFAFCAVFRFYHAAKMKKNTEKMEQVLAEFGAKADYEHTDIGRKERKEQYDNFLEQIEEEFNTDDIDDELM